MSREEEIAATLDASDPALDRTQARTTGGTTAQAVTDEQRGRYATSEELGRGGMGRVVVAADRHLDREVAMKLLLEGGASEHASVGAVTRFVREARVTGSLEHPGIVPVHELGRRADGTLYYTMKRIRGRSLADVLGERRTLAERLELAGVFRDVCDAMAYAHARGVVHRDLKPGNVMVGEFGETLVVDWGLAKVRGEEEARADLVDDPGRDAAQTVAGSVIGTPSYMSPEQARGDLPQIDERSDVWGLGAILFEILTGRPPFEGPTALAVLAKVLADDPPRVRELEPKAPPELAAIADRALSRDREARYADASEIAAEMAAWQDGRAVRAYDYSSWELVRRFVRRNRAASAAVLAVSIATLVASGLVYRSYLSEERQREAAERARDDARASDVRSRSTLADALLDRAERRLEAGDRAAAAVYAAAAMSVDPGGAEDDRHARDRHARAYSVWDEADRTRGWEYVRRTDADYRCAIVGERIVCPAGDGVDVERIADGAREHVVIEGIREAGAVRAIDARRIMIAAPGPEPIVDLETRRVVGHLPALTTAVFAGERGVAQMPDGSILVVRADDLSEIDRFPSGGIVTSNLAVSPDGGSIAVRTSTEVLIWHLPRGDSPLRVEAGLSPRLFAFSPDSRSLAIPRALPSVLVVDARAGTTLRELPARSATDAVSWIDRERLAIAHEQPAAVEIRGIDASSADDWVHPPHLGPHRLEAVAGFLVDLPVPPPDRRARGSVYRAVQSAGARELNPGGGVIGLARDPQDRVVVATPEGLRWSREDGREVRRLPFERGLDVVTSLLAVGSDGAVAWVTDEGGIMIAEPEASAARVAVPDVGRHFVLLGIELSPDADVVYAGTPGEGTIRRWSRTRGALPPLEGHTDTVLSLALSPDGRRLASASVDGTIRFWELDEGDRSSVLARQPHLFCGLAFSPDGARLAAGDGDGWIRVYEGTRLVSSARVHERGVNHLFFWHDGAWIVSAADDGTARVSSADGGAVDHIVRCAASCFGIVPSRAQDALYVQRDTTVARIPLRPGTGRRDPRALLARAEQRAGVRLEGLELVPVD